jgi:hypothetical protein
MKLNKRERTLWLIVGVSVCGMLAFNFVYRNLDRLQVSGVDVSELEETRRLLRSGRNIAARRQAAEKALIKLEKRFLDTSNPDTAKIQLLKEVETLIARAGLPVEQKNLLQLEPNIIGVAIEGNAEPAVLIRFLHASATTRMGLSVKRLQTHANEKTKQLKYQIILQLLLVEKKADQ